MDRVRPFKYEHASIGGNSADDVPFPTPLVPTQDAISIAGVYLQPDGGTEDTTVLVDRSGNNLRFTDPVAGTKTLSQLGGGGGAITQVEIDFGALAERCATFTITDAAVTAVSKIIATQAGAAPTGKSADENEMDALNLRCVPAAGSFTLYADSLTGYVRGNFKINYTAA